MVPYLIENRIVLHGVKIHQGSRIVAALWRWEFIAPVRENLFVEGW